MVQGENIYINVGTRAFVPPVNGLDEVDWIDNAGLLALEDLPKKLVIIGGGYIGVEFAQVFNRFGSEVTLIQRDTQLMTREDADVAHNIQKTLEEEGVRVLLGANTNKVSKHCAEVHLEVDVSGQSETIIGSDLFLAIGRTPNTSQLNLAVAGIKTNERGYIEVDDYCKTSVKGVFAVGDVNGHGAFTHTSVNDAEIVLDYLFNGDRKLSERQIVYGLFTDPPLGRVGMSEKEAIASGKNVLRATRTMTRISRAKEMGETKGFVKILVDADTYLFLGASILGVGGDEIINMFATAMQAGMTWQEYRKTVLVHPTVSELMPWTLVDLKPI
ncbi:MAG: FAD-dependent oxidoreductase [Reichenbachiella sp.]